MGSQNEQFEQDVVDGFYSSHIHDFKNITELVYDSREKVEALVTLEQDLKIWVSVLAWIGTQQSVM